MRSSLRKKLASVMIVCMLVAIIPCQVFAAGKTGWRKAGKAFDDRYEWRYYITSKKYAKGWKKIGKYWYYFQKDGIMMREHSLYGYEPGMVKDNGKWYYFDFGGRMHKSKWIETGYGITYLNSSGAAVSKKGWKKIKGKWYYFTKQGQYGPSVAYVNRTVTINGKKYKFNSKGVCKNK